MLPLSGSLVKEGTEIVKEELPDAKFELGWPVVRVWEGLTKTPQVTAVGYIMTVETALLRSVQSSVALPPLLRKD